MVVMDQTNFHKMILSISPGFNKSRSMIQAMENIPIGYSQNVKNLVSKPRQVLSQEMENRLKTKVCMTNYFKEGYAVPNLKCHAQKVWSWCSSIMYKFLTDNYHMSCNQRKQN